MKRAIIYMRVSTEEQAEKGYSLQAQRYECREKAKELGCDDILEYCDEGVSGSILERPMLLNALEAMRQYTASYFICYDPSRLSRNVSHQLILIDNIKKYKVKLIFVRSSYDDTAEGRFQITIMAAVDEYERARLKIRTELGKRAKAKAKLLTHNPNIYGYCFNKDNDTLYINEAQSDIVRRIFHMLVNENLGPSKIADRLNELKIPSMRGKDWNRVCINRMLKNETYTGRLYIRRYDTKDYRLNKFKKKSEKVKISQRPKEQWIAIDVPAIIGRETWEMAQNMLEKSKRVFKNRENETYMLSGMLKCGKCGGTMFCKTSTNNRYYCCINKYNYKLKPDDRCCSKLIRAAELENEVWRSIRQLLLNRKEIEKLLQKVLYNKEEMIFNEDNRGAELDLNFNISGRLNDLKKMIKSVLSIDYEELNADDLIDKLAICIDNLSTEQNNSILQKLIRNITIDDKIVRIHTFLSNKCIEYLQS